MSNIQELLDKEANLANRRYHVLQQIKAARGDMPPRCWGQDDCSSSILIHCPWRIDCDSTDATQYQQSNFS